MIYPKKVLMKMAVELRTKTDEQLKDLYNIYNSQLNRLSDKEYEFFCKSIHQKLELVKQEIYKRDVEKTQIQQF